IEKLPVPEGLLPITDIGDETIAGATWGKFALARWAWHKVIRVYAGGVRLADTHANVRHADHPSWPFPTRTLPLGDCECMILYLRGDVLNKHRDGTAIVRVNACTPEDQGEGHGSPNTQTRGRPHAANTQRACASTRARPRIRAGGTPRRLRKPPAACSS